MYSHRAVVGTKDLSLKHIMMRWVTVDVKFTDRQHENKQMDEAAFKVDQSFTSAEAVCI